MLGLHLSTTGHHNGSCNETSVKTALAAGLGSSLFLFRGLDRLSPRIFTEASLQPPSSSSPKTPVSATASSPTSSFRTAGRTNSSGSMGGIASKSKAHRPQYSLIVQCSECTRLGKACPYTGDINYGDRNRMAFEDERYQGSRPTERIFEFHVCSWNQRPMEVVDKFMRRGDSGAPKEPFRVNDLFEELRGAGAKPVWVNGGW